MSVLFNYSVLLLCQYDLLWPGFSVSVSFGLLLKTAISNAIGFRQIFTKSVP